MVSMGIGRTIVLNSFDELIKELLYPEEEGMAYHGMYISIFTKSEEEYSKGS